MRIRSIRANNRRRSFELSVSSRTLVMPYAKVDPRPGSDDQVTRVYPDDDLGREGFTYVLASGQEGTVHIEQVLEYNEDPRYLRDALLYKLTLEVRKRLESTTLSRREIIRRMGTSATQFYRLLDATNARKSIDQMVRLLRALDCQVDFVIKARGA